MHHELQQERTRRLALQHILETTATAHPDPPQSRSPSKPARQSHAKATQSTACSPPTTPVANTSTTSAQSTSWSQPQSDLGDSRNNLHPHPPSQDLGPWPKSGTRSHAEVQMRLQAFSNPQSQVTVQHTNTQIFLNNNDSSSSSSSSIVNSNSNNKISCRSGPKSNGLLNEMHSKIEGSKSNLQSQQQVQFHQLMEQLEQQNRATEASEKRAQYWQNVAHVEQSKAAASLSVTNTNNHNHSTSSHSNHTSSNTNISIIRGDANSNTADSVKVLYVLFLGSRSLNIKNRLVTDNSTSFSSFKGREQTSQGRIGAHGG